MIVNFDEFNSIPGIFYHQANKLKDQPYLWKKENDKYVSLSWSQVKEQVESLATYLKDLGILEGDRVLILSENRPEWQITDLAIMSIGAISVPAYTTSTTNDYKYIIEHSKSRGNPNYTGNQTENLVFSHSKCFWGHTCAMRKLVVLFARI